MTKSVFIEVLQNYTGKIQLSSKMP